MELQLATVVSAHEAKEREWKEKLDAAKIQADKGSREQKAEIARLKEQVMDQKKAGEEAIAKFKASEAYDREIADAGAPEIFHSWVVAERHIKTDPDAN